MNFKEFLLETTQLSKFFKGIKSNIHDPDSFKIFADVIEDIGAPLLSQYMRKSADILQSIYTRTYQQQKWNHQEHNTILTELRKFGITHIEFNISLDAYYKATVYSNKPITKNQIYDEPYFPNEYEDEYYNPGADYKDITNPSELESEEDSYLNKEKLLQLGRKSKLSRKIKKPRSYECKFLPNGLIYLQYGFNRAISKDEYKRYFSSYDNVVSKMINIADIDNIGIQLAYVYTIAYFMNSGSIPINTDKLPKTPRPPENANYSIEDFLTHWFGVFNQGNLVNNIFIQQALRVITTDIRSGYQFTYEDLMAILRAFEGVRPRNPKGNKYEIAIDQFRENIPNMIGNLNLVLRYLGKIHRSMY